MLGPGVSTMPSAVSAMPSIAAVESPMRTACQPRRLAQMVRVTLWAGASARPRPTVRSGGSDVEVERELVRRRAQPDRVDLVLPLVFQPGRDDVGREDAALQQELVIGL